jgi:hypothetical protein
MAYARKWDRKRTAEGAKTAWESQGEPYSPTRFSLDAGAGWGRLETWEPASPLGIDEAWVLVRWWASSLLLTATAHETAHAGGRGRSNQEPSDAN